MGFSAAQGPTDEAASLRAQLSHLEMRLAATRAALAGLRGAAPAGAREQAPRGCCDGAASQPRGKRGGPAAAAAAAAPEPLQLPTSPHRFIDIGVNFTDGMFRGEYRGKQQHEDDRREVLRRAALVGCRRWIITGGSLQESREAAAAAREFSGVEGVQLYLTVGCHPTRCNEFETGETTLEGLREVLRAERAAGRCVAVGECGLDYDPDRERFCPRDVQKKWLAAQLRLAEEEGLPLFLHNRATGVGGDFAEAMRANPWLRGRAVSHSFTGTVEEMDELVSLGLYIGINGCSLRDEANLRVAARVPADRLLLETDAPWCDVRPTHAGHRFVRTVFPTAKSEKKWVRGQCVKSRQEPAHIVQVLEVVAGARECDPGALAEQVYANSLRLFFPGEVS